MIALPLAGPPSIHPTRFTMDVAIHVVARSRSDTILACEQIGAPTRVDSRAGCAEFNPRTRVCTIYFVGGTRASAELHERTHCYFGRWHRGSE